MRWRELREAVEEAERLHGVSFDDAKVQTFDDELGGRETLNDADVIIGPTEITLFFVPGGAA